MGLQQVDSLVASRANIEAATLEGWTALHWACSRGAEAVARRLLLAGAMVVAMTEDGSSPLSLAQERALLSDFSTLQPLQPLQSLQLLQFSQEVAPQLSAVHRSVFCFAGLSSSLCGCVA